MQFKNLKLKNIFLNSQTLSKRHPYIKIQVKANNRKKIIKVAKRRNREKPKRKRKYKDKKKSKKK